jgi:hypothetical protein
MIVAMVGCGQSGPNLHTVSGKVTFQGKPVATGLIRFHSPPLGIDLMAYIRADGTYRVKMAQGDGLPEGEYQVAIEPPRVEVPVGVMKLPPALQRPDIPAKYRQPATSGLKLTVAPGDNQLDIDMLPDR